ncbi:hypothetical protein E4U60_004577 [Claviceps pazoutovae]|uniref:Myb-like domain-containing protein n=1 Tax=Claviceps pazoutovae TaxID=1649127 RepID=A0A9P7SFS4_9HYPO|nr:hypothetical protein E4U60_004577 [Claviceps pazoutovae]
MILTRARGRGQSMSGTDATATLRRSARHMSGPSPASLSTGSGPTRNAKDYDDDEDDEDDEDDADYGNRGDGDDEDDGDDDNGAEEDDAAVTKAWEIQYDLITYLLPDLQGATHDLKQRIENGDDGHKAFGLILEAKRGMFRSLIKALNYPASQVPFIDFELLERLAKKGRGTKTDSIIRASLAANLVYALDRIQQIVNDDPVDVLSFIKDLDKAFPVLLDASGDSASPSLALEIRTQVFIRTLAAQPGEPDVAAAIASVIGASDDNRDNSNHDASPNDIVGTFKSLFYTGETEEEIRNITLRSRQLAALFCRDKESQALRRLEEDFPLKPLLREIYTWCGKQFRLVQEAEEEVEDHGSASADEPVNGEEDIFQDALGVLPSMLDTPIRIPIVRRSPDFHKKETRVRPQREPSLDASSDCSIATGMLLQRNSGASLPTTGKRRLGQGVDGDHDDYQDYYHNNHNGGHDDDQGSETDEFETDARQNHNPDAVNPLPPSKRQALPRQQLASSSMPSSSMPHRATLPRGGTSIPTSDRPNLENVRAMRERNLHHARAQDLAPNPTSRRPLATASPPSSSPHFPAITRQRNPWSDDDSTLLVKLIALERAKWSVIDRKHGHRFEIPRNQQAYRDRARNMKVDFLLADAVLPPGFDLVGLGKKEERKVVAGRRNPHRKEDDRDENGRPINTRI